MINTDEIKEAAIAALKEIAETFKESNGGEIVGVIKQTSPDEIMFKIVFEPYFFIKKEGGAND